MNKTLRLYTDVEGFIVRIVVSDGRSFTHSDGLYDPAEASLQEEIVSHADPDQFEDGLLQMVEVCSLRQDPPVRCK